MSLDSYEGPGEVQVDQNTLAEATSISVQLNGNNNPVTTMKKGYAGNSKGAGTVDIQVENAVPKAGMEVDLIEKVKAGASITITHVWAGKTYVYPGIVDSVDIQQGTDSPASVSFSATCQMPDIV